MSSSTLAERAAGLARPGVDSPAPSPEPEQHRLPLEPDDEPQPPDSYPMPDQVLAHIAWNRVMRDVTHVAKGRRVTEGPAKYAFRGIEDVVQAFASAVRRHGVIVGPVKTQVSYESGTSKNGAKMRECDTVVTWTVIGPMGDVLPTTFETAGEAVDYSDKATTKSQSIAYRTLLLTLGMVPVDDPEPDATYIERGDAAVPPPPTAEAYAAEITNPMTPRERFRQIYNEIGKHRLPTSRVEHEGVSLELGALFMQVSNQRWPKVAPAPTHTGDHDETGFGADCQACRAISTGLDRQAAGEEGAS